MTSGGRAIKAPRNLALAASSMWESLPKFTAVGSTLKFNGESFHLKGVSWFGLEGVGKVPDGLWVNNLAFYLDFLSENGFNALRVPVALDSVLKNPLPSQELLSAAPELIGIDYLGVLDVLIDKAAERGILVLLDMHRLEASRWPTDGLWYGPHSSLETLKESWKILSERFCQHWNVLGADVFNEPHGAKWKDWALTSGELGNFVLSKCSRWLIFVEGVAHEGKTGKAEYFWGENLEDAKKKVVDLSMPNKLVYSPHVYGPGDGQEEHHMPYFDANDFPRNMASVWDQHFGFLIESGLTVVIGEWGGIYKDKDKLWQDAFYKYISERGLSFFYWSLNPNSGDTGGLLRSDWKTPEELKLRLIQSAPSSHLIPKLQGVPAFQCLAKLPEHHFKCANDAECIFEQQSCNGVYECRDRSDEIQCTGSRRPCLALNGEGAPLPCTIPFVYNGFEYQGCTSVDALDSWPLVGVGLCKHGFIPAVASNGISLEQCQLSCLSARRSNCSLISYTMSGGGYCSGYSSACRMSPLNTAKFEYQTYEHREDGGPWCPTQVGAGNTFISYANSGICGPGCPIADIDDSIDPRRSRCRGTANLDSLPSHCAPSPPPPPNPPVLPPSPSPPHDPPPLPTLPPPLAPSFMSLLLESQSITSVIRINAAGAMFVLIICICTAILYRPRNIRRIAHQGRRRQISLEELEVLSASYEHSVSETCSSRSGSHYTSLKPQQLGFSSAAARVPLNTARVY